MRRHKKFRGRHKFICDVDGMAYYSEDKRIRWDGAVVHKKNWEPRHPQDLIKAIRDDTSITDPRPEGEDTFITYAADEVETIAFGYVALQGDDYSNDKIECSWSDPSPTSVTIEGVEASDFVVTTTDATEYEGIAIEMDGNTIVVTFAWDDGKMAEEYPTVDYTQGVAPILIDDAEAEDFTGTVLYFDS